MTEAEAIPAHPDNEYGWEKLYSERMAMAYGRRYGMQVRIARFQNCYGPEGTWRGGREKAPAAMCRKVALVPDGGTIEIWGDGSAVRSYTYVDDMVDGIYRLMHSDLRRGREHRLPAICHRQRIGGGRRRSRRQEDPASNRSRARLAFSLATSATSGSTRSAGAPQFDLRKGIELTYPWVAEQVKKTGHRE